MRIIVIDGRAISESPRGVGQFLVNSVCALASLCPDRRLIIASNKEIAPESLVKIEKYNNVSIIIEPLKLIPNKGVLWFLFYLPRLIKREGADVFWAPAVLIPFLINKSVKTLITVHDVVHKEFASTMSFRNRVVNYLCVDRSINNADYIWAVSNYTKSEIERYYPNRKSKNIVVGSSINTDFYKKTEVSLVDKISLYSTIGADIDKKHLLFVGTLEPRKNLQFLLSLMPRLSAQNYQLIVVGGKGWGNTSIADIINDEHFPKESVVFPGYLSDMQLLMLYNSVDCFVSTSLNEGFGLPQLEAIACGLPVVTASNSAMKEVVNGAGILVEGWDHTIWIDSINRAISDRYIIKKSCAEKLRDYQWCDISRRVCQYIENNYV